MTLTVGMGERAFTGKNGGKIFRDKAFFHPQCVTAWADAPDEKPEPYCYLCREPMRIVIHSGSGTRGTQFRAVYAGLRGAWGWAHTECVDERMYMRCSQCNAWYPRHMVSKVLWFGDGDLPNDADWLVHQPYSTREPDPPELRFCIACAEEADATTKRMAAKYDRLFEETRQKIIERLRSGASRLSD